MKSRCTISVEFWYLTYLSFTSFFQSWKLKFYLAIIFNVSQSIPKLTLIATITSGSFYTALIMADFKIWDLWSLLRISNNISACLLNAASELPELVSICISNILFIPCIVLLFTLITLFDSFGFNINEKWKWLSKERVVWFYRKWYF